MSLTLAIVAAAGGALAMAFGAVGAYDPAAALCGISFVVSVVAIAIDRG